MIWNLVHKSSNISLAVRTFGFWKIWGVLRAWENLKIFFPHKIWTMEVSTQLFLVCLISATAWSHAKLLEPFEGNFVEEELIVGKAGLRLEGTIADGLFVTVSDRFRKFYLISFGLIRTVWRRLSCSICCMCGDLCNYNWLHYLYLHLGSYVRSS